MRVLLFDIDGTLIRSNGSGKASLEKALAETFKLESATADIDYGGRTDFSIVRELLDLNGVEYSDENASALLESYCSLISEFLVATKATVLPGVVKLLNELKDMSEFSIGILTGNIKHGADVKLNSTNLASFFHFGGYGDRAELRNGIAEEALESAKEYLGDTKIEKVFVIGDTPKDVECAKHIGAFSLAVGTGYAEKEAILASNPDIFLEDLSNTEEVISIFRAD